MRRTRENQLELPLRFRQQQAVGRAHLALEGRLVSYTIKRSLRRRAISILVDEEGLRVGAPWDANHSAIERVLRRHSDWVLRKLDEWQMRRVPSRHWADREPLMLLGENLTLRIASPEDGPLPVRRFGAELYVTVTDGPGGSAARQVHEWLQTRALACYEDRVDNFRRLIGIEKAPQVFLSSARTRWGSCHVSGRIHLNWRLVQMPLPLIDYVVAHEVAHLLEMNHSKRFWRTVGRMIPDYPVRRAELRHEGHRYMLV